MAYSTSPAGLPLSAALRSQRAAAAQVEDAEGVLRVGELGIGGDAQQLHRPGEVGLAAARQKQEGEIVGGGRLALGGGFLEPGLALLRVLVHAAPVEGHEAEGGEG